MRLFSKKDLSTYLSNKLINLRNEIVSEEKNKLLNVIESEYIEYLVAKYSIEPIRFYWNKMTVSDQERMIPSDWFPSNYYVERGNSYSKQVLTFHIPFTGNRELLEYKPSTFLMWSLEVNVNSRSISFELVNFGDESERIKNNVENNKRDINQQNLNVKKEVDNFNLSLEANTRSIVSSRKQQLLKMTNLLESLGVEVKKVDNPPETFSIPLQKKRPLIKPDSSRENFSPEPSLDSQVYEEILNICHQVGVEMERHPSIYHQKIEETLRDHFLMVMSPHFESVTGETFNKSGKTDILIRHEKSNVFVAECKYWNGGKSLIKAINQILRYLTWRESKAAIILFIKNKELDPVLTQIRESSKQHPCFMRFKGNKIESWFEYEFHLLDDKTRKVTLTILCFHFPT